jgi:hypothetical protein
MAINLDKILEDQLSNKQQPAVEVVEQPKPIVNWDEILTEWSYRCPKGYPTVVDGVFTEREEVVILNEILEERFEKTIPLPEAKPKAKPGVGASPSSLDWTKDEEDIMKVLSSVNINGVTSIGVDEDAEGESKSNKKTTFISIRPVVGTGEKGRVDICGEFVKALKEKQYNVSTNTRERKPFAFIIDYNQRSYYCKVREPLEYTDSDTDIKEGFSLLFGYYPTNLEKFTENDVVVTATAMKKWLSGKDVDANVEDGLKKKLLEFLDRVIKVETSTDDPKKLKKYKKAFAGFLNQALSHGRTFETFFGNNPDFYIERGTFFNDIRKAGKKISNSENYDKWCPGDVYFIRNGSEDSINSILTAIDNYKKEDKVTDEQLNLLAQLNSLFSPIFDKQVSKTTPIVAVSLKMAKAQAGKLKSALAPTLKNIGNLKPPKTFNLEPKEVTASIEDLAKMAKASFKDFMTAVKTEKESRYSYSTGTAVTDDRSAAITNNASSIDALVKLASRADEATQTELKDKLKYKYASYKMLNFIISNYVGGKGEDFDQAMKVLAAYGLGIAEKPIEKEVYVNPPFFKVIANEDATAMVNGDAVRPEFFQPGVVVSLAPINNVKLTIIDTFPTSVDKAKDGMKGLKIDYNILLNSNKNRKLVPQKDEYELSVNFRPNGSSQITVELQKAHLK